MPCDDCLKLGMPLILCTDNKPYPLQFENGELVFRRHNQPGSEQEIKKLSENQIGNTIFKLDNDSYNRSSLSRSEQVLLNEFQTESKGLNYYKDWGIISLPVDSVNSINGEVILNNIKSVGTLKVEHKITPCNYSHSEVLLYIDGKIYDGKAPKSARPYFRRALQKQLTLVKEFYNK